MDKENEAHYPLVLVTWVDSTTYSGWTDLDTAYRAVSHEVQSTGFILRNDDIFLTLAMSLSEHEGEGLGTLDIMVLPKGCVMRVETLGLVSSCGCGAEDEEEFENLGQDCWGAPAPEDAPTLETKPGDDNLGRQLTLDEWMRRGGTVMSWPPIVEGKEGDKRVISLMESALERKLEESK